MAGCLQPKTNTPARSKRVTETIAQRMGNETHILAQLIEQGGKTIATHLNFPCKRNHTSVHSVGKLNNLSIHNSRDAEPANQAASTLGEGSGTLLCGRSHTQLVV